MRAILVALALPLAACSGAPSEPGVTATRVLEITGLQPVVNAVALSPNGSLVVVGDFDDDLIAREVPSGAERWKVRVQPGRERRRIDGVFFSPDASLVVTTGHEAQTLEVWDAATGRSVAVLDTARSASSPTWPRRRTMACTPSCATRWLSRMKATGCSRPTRTTAGCASSTCRAARPIPSCRARGRSTKR